MGIDYFAWDSDPWSKTVDPDSVYRCGELTESGKQAVAAEGKAADPSSTAGGAPGLQPLEVIAGPRGCGLWPWAANPAGAAGFSIRWMRAAECGAAGLRSAGLRGCGTTGPGL